MAERWGRKSLSVEWLSRLEKGGKEEEEEEGGGEEGKKKKKSVLTTFNFTTSGPLMDGLVNDGILRQFIGSDLMGFPLNKHTHTSDEPAPLIQTPASPAPQRRANTSSPGTHAHTTSLFTAHSHTHTHARAHTAAHLLSVNMQMFSITALREGGWLRRCGCRCWRCRHLINNTVHARVQQHHQSADGGLFFWGGVKYL